MCEHKDNTTEPPDDSSWQDDIEKRDYYYDDSTGYEIYVEEDGESEELGVGSKE